MAAKCVDVAVEHTDASSTAVTYHVGHHDPLIANWVIFLNRTEGRDSIVATAHVQLPTKGPGSKGTAQYSS